MSYLCSAESAIATCDSYNWDKTKFRRKKKATSNKLRRFSYAELEAATNAFSPCTLLGKGSHSAVFRAVIDNASLTVAVKRITPAVIFTAENQIEILSKIRSRRIVNLIGYAVDSSDKKLLLVVEYMPNGSLYDLIHRRPKSPGWSNRVRFALQVAKAVQTLHGSNPPVIHRDIKSSNVLIDERENARLSDFGLALRGNVEDDRVMSTPPAGTLGYLDPCYLAPGDLSTKSDVFSFGILLLEIISGRRAIDVNYSPPSIVEWALPLIKSGNYHALCDRRIGCPTDPTMVKKLAVLAARCVRSTAEKRPSMAEIVERIRLIYKRVQAMAVPLWNNLRRRVRHVGRSRSLDGSFDGSEREELVWTPRRGSRKASHGPGSEPGYGRIGKEMPGGNYRLRRSKSIGSFREIKMGPDSGVGEISGRTRWAQVTVKLSTVKLSKSRSTSVLRSGKLDGKEVDVFQVEMKASNVELSTAKSIVAVKKLH